MTKIKNASEEFARNGEREWREKRNKEIQFFLSLLLSFQLVTFNGLHWETDKEKNGRRFPSVTIKFIKCSWDSRQESRITRKTCERDVTGWNVGRKKCRQWWRDMFDLNHVIATFLKLVPSHFVLFHSTGISVGDTEWDRRFKSDNKGNSWKWKMIIFTLSSDSWWSTVKEMREVVKLFQSFSISHTPSLQ